MIRFAEELADVLPVEMDTFRLDHRSFVGFDFRPLKKRLNLFHRTGNGSFPIGVFDSEEKLAVGRFGEEIIIQSGAETTEMELTGGRRGETDTDGGGHRSWI